MPELARLKILRNALKLEVYGLVPVEASAYDVLLKDYGFKGYKEEVLKALNERIFNLSQIPLELPCD